jgi:hypothetical protein
MKRLLLQREVGVNRHFLRPAIGGGNIIYTKKVLAKDYSMTHGAHLDKETYSQEVLHQQWSGNFCDMVGGTGCRFI